jgi:hypothetical protein
MARAIVDIRKITGYCLNSEHPRGRHKARVFAAVLGITVDHAEELRHLLLANAAAGDARLAGSDQYGDRYMLDFDVARGAWIGRVRSPWIVRNAEQVPRLITCYVLT